MFNKYQAVFRSRWKALMWAAGVCLTAYCTVPSADQTDQAQPAAPPRHVNPWANDYHPAAPRPHKEDAIDQLADAVRAAENRAPAHQQHVNPWARKPDQQQH